MRAFKYRSHKPVHHSLLTNPTDDRGGGGIATNCDDGGGDSGLHFCCGEATPESNCFSDANNAFIWGNASIINNYIPIASQSLTSSSASSTNNDIPIASQSLSSSGASQTAKATATCAAESESTESPAVCKDNTVAIGAGLGASLGCAIIVATVFAWLFFRSRSQVRKAGPTLSPQHQGFAYYSDASPLHHHSDVSHAVELPGVAERRILELPSSARTAGESSSRSPVHTSGESTTVRSPLV